VGGDVPGDVAGTWQIHPRRAIRPAAVLSGVHVVTVFIIFGIIIATLFFVQAGAGFPFSARPDHLVLEAVKLAS
jgi:hypothetical protein